MAKRGKALLALVAVGVVMSGCAVQSVPAHQQPVTMSTSKDGITLTLTVERTWLRQGESTPATLTVKDDNPLAPHVLCGQGSGVTLTNGYDTNVTASLLMTGKCAGGNGRSITTHLTIRTTWNSCDREKVPGSPKCVYDSLPPLAPGDYWTVDSNGPSSSGPTMPAITIHIQ